MFSRSVFRAAARTTLSPASRSPAVASSLHRLLSTETKKLIDDAVNSTPVVVFMKGTPEAPQCGFSRAVIQIMDVQDVIPEKVKTFNVLADPELREAIKEYSEWPTIPQVYVKGEFVGGCDIVLAMHTSGELEDLFLKEGVVPPLPEVPGQSSASEETK